MQVYSDSNNHLDDLDNYLDYYNTFLRGVWNTTLEETSGRYLMIHVDLRKSDSTTGPTSYRTVRKVRLVRLVGLIRLG